MNKKLKDYIKNTGASWYNKAADKHLEKEIVKEYSSVNNWDKFISDLRKTSFTQLHIYSFVELEDGTLIGWNESPSHGWSFPVGKWK